MTTELAELERGAPQLDDEAKKVAALVERGPITNATGYETAGGMMRIARGMEDAITGYWSGTDADPGPKKAAHRLWRSLCDKEAEQLALARQLLVTPLDRLMKGWEAHVREQERIARAAEEKARREAEERALAEAAELEEAGFDAAAERVLDAPPVAPAVVVPPEVTAKAEGVSQRGSWDFEITDPAAIKRSIIDAAAKETAAAKLKSSWLGQHIRRLVRAHGEKAAEMVGGIKVGKKYSRAVRR